ncbi:MAG TPA: hypothetical protein VGU23_00545 [Acidobacteriaceae bacterium]|nr:hypothetical protein [Acidobacteriaceae bacterium]
MKEHSIYLSSLLFIVSVFSQAQTAQIQSLKVQSAWGGLGMPGHAEFSVQRKGTSYNAKSRAIAVDLVNAFVNAVQAAPLTSPTATNLGITAQWLQAHEDQAGGEASRLYYKDGLPEQKAFFQKAFEDQRTLPLRVKEVYESSHTDDYPHMRVEIILQNGTKIILSTDSQNPYMLPWVIATNGSAKTTYNANISRALFALLPANFVNRERLTQERDSSLGLVAMLGEETATTVERQWELIGAQYASGDALAVLKTSYKVRSAEVNPYHDLAFGKAWDGGEPHEENLHAVLWRDGFPKNFTMTAILLREDGKTEGASDLLKKAPAFEDLVFSVQWLNIYFKSHADESSWLFYVHGESLTDKAMQIFAADMKTAGRTDLVERVRAVQSQAALLETGQGDYWIILPDKTSILWRWQSPNHILKWRANEFPAHECSEYRAISGGCAGVVIAPDGDVEVSHTNPTNQEK